MILHAVLGNPNHPEYGVARVLLLIGKNINPTANWQNKKC